MTADETAVRRLSDELKEWGAVRALFADGPIDVDMSSLVGGGPVELTAEQLIAGFRTGLHAGKLSHHMTTNHRVEVTGDRAEVSAQAYALNCVPSLPGGSNLWETRGAYRLTCRRTPAGWRLTGFRYDSRLTRGDDAVRTHSA